jgi:hypothetical protein
MSESSFDKWPIEFKIVRMTTSPLNQELELYFVSGIMNTEQSKTLKEFTEKSPKTDHKLKIHKNKKL